MRLPAEEIIWGSSGWLARRPADDAWLILAGALLLGALLIAVSYRHTLVRLSPLRRVLLALLRFAAWTALLVILAGPTRITRIYERSVRPTRPLAVLVDRSDSMTAPDNRQQRRLDDALVQWRRIEPAARRGFRAVASFAFGDAVVPIAAVTDDARLNADRTAFFASIDDVLARAPAGGWGGLVVLTDGVDTTGVVESDARRHTVAAALKTGTPLYFVVGRNRVLEPDFFRLREFNVPAKTEPHSVVRLNAIFESSRTAATTLPVELLNNGQSRAAGSVHVEAGRRMEAWNAEGRVESPGRIVFELRVGGEKARTEVAVEVPQSRRVLYDAGTLSWGYRAIAEALSGNDRFTVEPLFGFASAELALPPGALTAFPSPPALAAYGYVVLDGVEAEQLSAAQQAALAAWVKDGGILLAIYPDDVATQFYGGTELEKILPVIFAGVTSASAVEPTPAPLRAEATTALLRPEPRALTPVRWDNPARAREIFGAEPPQPAFSSYARVVRVKPGADVLARHPRSVGPDGQPAVLLAVQPYGRGKTAVLATDALWRWRLQEPHGATSAATFWVDFLEWLGRDRDNGFHFEHPPVHASQDQDLTVRLVGAKNPALVVEASGDGRTLALTEVTGDDTARLFRWKPPAPGFWQIEARDPEQRSARMWVTVDAPTAKRGELPASAPDERLLQALAEETSGGVLSEAPATWNQKVAPPQLLSQRREPLWNRAWVLAVLLGIYSLELVLRRRWQLL